MNLGYRIANLLTLGELARLERDSGATARRLQESDILLARLMEDAQWKKAAEVGGTDRAVFRRMSRLAFQRTEPFVKNGLLLQTYFCFGQGVDGYACEDEAAKGALKDFWNDPVNRQTLFDTDSQILRSLQLLLDGDLFLLVDTIPGKPVQVRLCPVSYVTHIIADPTDAARVVAFKCLIPQVTWSSDSGTLVPSGGGETVYYREWRNNKPEDDPLEGQVPYAGNGHRYMMHVAINRIDDADFGMPEPTTSLQWFEKAGEIAKDQAVISRATAVLMNRLSVTGESDIGSIQAAMMAQGQNPNKSMAGSIQIIPEGQDLKVERGGTGANDATTNSRIMRIEGAAGMGLSLHYLSDPENANLATASSMELPVLQRLQGYQAVWSSLYRNLGRVVLNHEKMDPTIPIEVPMPRIIAPDIPSLTDSLVNAHREGIITHRQAGAWLLDALRFDDIDEELVLLDKEMEEKRQEEIDMMEMQQGFQMEMADKAAENAIRSDNAARQAKDSKPGVIGLPGKKARPTKQGQGGK